MTAPPSLPPTAPRRDAGGALRPGDRYIERSADSELVSALLAGEFCYVLAPRQIGKSSLRVRTARELSLRGVRCTSVTLEQIGTAVSAEQWYYTLADAIAEGLGLPVDLGEFWEEQGQISSVKRLLVFLEKQVLALPGRIVVFIDEIDTLLSLPAVQDDFFAAIRSLYNERAERPELSRLSFCMLGVATPTDLMKDPVRTPFNIGRAVRLRDFSEEEARGFLPELAGLVRPAEELLTELYRWTSGHPYMMHRLCIALHERSERQQALDVDAAVHDCFLERGRQGDLNLQYPEKRLDRYADVTPLLSLYRRLLRGEIAEAQSRDRDQAELLLCGLVAEREAASGTLVLQVRNAIFKHVYDEAWVAERTARRELYQAYLRWQAEGRPDSLLLRGPKLEEALAWEATHRRELTAEEGELLRASERAVYSAQVQGERQARTEAEWHAAQTRADAAVREAQQQATILRERQEQTAARTRTLRRIVAILLAALLLTIGFAAWGYWQRQQTLAAALSEAQARTAMEKSALETALAKEAAESSARFENSQRIVTQAAQENRPLSTLVAAMLAVAPEVKSGKFHSKSWEGLFVALQHMRGSRALVGHEGSVFSAAFSPIGNRVVTAGSDRLIRIWDAGTQALLSTLRGHEDFVRCVEFSPDGNRLLSAGDDGLVRVWDMISGEIDRTLPASGSIRSATFSPDGRRILTAGDSGEIILWDSWRGTQLRRFSASKSPIFSASFSPDGGRIVAAGWDGVVRVWNVKTGKTEFVQQGHVGPIRAAVFSPDGTRILTAGDDASVRIWDARKGKNIETLARYEEPILAARFSPSGDRILTASADGTARILDARTGEILLTLQGHVGAIHAAVLSTDGDRLVTASADHTARIWDLGDGQARRLVEGQLSAFSADGSRILVAPTDFTHDSVTFLFDAETGQALWMQRGRTARFSPRGLRVFASTVNESVDKTELYSAQTGDPLLTLKGHEAQFSPDETRITTVVSAKGKTAATPETEQPSIRLWNVETGELIATLSGEDARFSPDSSRIATRMITRIAETKLWDARSGRLLLTLQGQDARFSPDGTGVVTSSADGNERLFDLQTGKLLQTLRGYDATFVQDGRILTATVDKSERRLWDLKSGQPLLTIPKHDILLSPDRTSAITASDDETVQLLDLGSGQVLKKLLGNDARFSPTGDHVLGGVEEGTVRIFSARNGSSLPPLQGDPGFVRSAAFSPRAARIVTGSDEGTVGLWDVQTGRALMMLQQRGRPVRSVSFSPDGGRIAVEFDDVTVLHPGGNEAYYARACSILRSFPDLPRGLPDITPKDLKKALSECGGSPLPKAQSQSIPCLDPNRAGGTSGTAERTDPKDKAETEQEVSQSIKVLKESIAKADDRSPETSELRFRLAQRFHEQYRIFSARQRKLDRELRDSEAENESADRTRIKEKRDEAEKLARQSLLDGVQEYLKLVIEPRQKDWPKLDQVLAQLASSLLVLNKEDQARGYLKRLVNELPKSAFIPHAYLAFGESFFERKDVASALTYYAKVTEYPGSSVYGHALYKKAWVFYNLRDFGQAQSAFLQVLEYANGPNAACAAGTKDLAEAAKKDLVRSYAQVGLPEKAWPLFSRVGKQDAPEMLDQLAELYNAQGKFRESNTTYRQLIKIDPALAKLCGIRTAILKNTLSDTGSRALPEVVKELKQLSAVYAKIKSTPDLAKSAVDECRDHTAGMLRELATVWHKEAQRTGVIATYVSARDLYEEYLRHFPSEKDVYMMRYWYAELLFKLGTLDTVPASHWYCDAAPVYTEVVKVDPQGPKLNEAAYAAVIAWKNCLDLDETSTPVRGKTEADIYTPKPIPETQQKMLAAFDTYIQFVKKSSELATIKYRKARIYYDYNHHDEALPLFRDLAQNHQDSELAVYSANLALEIMVIKFNFELGLDGDDTKRMDALVDRFLSMPWLTKDAELLSTLREIKAKLHPELGPVAQAPAAPSKPASGQQEGEKKRPVPPAVVSGTAEVREALDKELIKRIVNRHFLSLRFCFEQFLDDPSASTASRKVDVKFTIQESGDVSQASIVKSDYREPKLHQCLLDRVTKMKFPKPMGGFATATTSIDPKGPFRPDIRPFSVDLSDLNTPRLAR